jgi:hypothetical protein
MIDWSWLPWNWNQTDEWRVTLNDENQLIQQFNAMLGTRRSSAAQFTPGERAKLESTLGTKINWSAFPSIAVPEIAPQTILVSRIAEGSLYVAAAADAAAAAAVAGTTAAGARVAAAAGAACKAVPRALKALDLAGRLRRALEGPTRPLSTAERTNVLRRFFKGEKIPRNQQNIDALLFYRRIAQDALEKYAARGYTGSGVATQTKRLGQIADQLAEWGIR